MTAKMATFLLHVCGSVDLNWWIFKRDDKLLF